MTEAAQWKKNLIFIVLIEITVCGWPCRTTPTHYPDSKPTSLCSYFLKLLSEEAANTHFIVFGLQHSSMLTTLWFDLTGALTHGLQHSSMLTTLWFDLIGALTHGLQHSSMLTTLWFYLTGALTHGLQHSSMLTTL